MAQRRQQAGGEEVAATSLVSRPVAASPSHHRWWIPLLLVLLTVLVYSNSWQVPFVFDDETAILTNASIRDLVDLPAVLAPPRGESVGGRPILNLTFAINYAISGTAVWSYHLGNLLIHLSAGLLLFGLIRRILSWRGMPSGDTDAIAGVTALLFLLHPLQTESVTYVVQRAESLTSCWYLLTLYAAVRSATGSDRTRRWQVVAVVACLLGMGTKEIMVTAPLVVWGLDRFALASPERRLPPRRGFYWALAATWLPLLVVVAGNGRGATAGIGAGMPVLEYLGIQVRAVPQYLLLAFWPDPLVFDYGRAAALRSPGVTWHLFAMAGLVVAGVVAWRRSTTIGFLITAIFLLLAPSSSLVPVVTQPMAEHRLYLALAIVMLLLVLAMHRVAGRRGVQALACWALVLGVLTVFRNADYATRRSLWEDTIAKVPDNARAYHNLGRALLEEEELDEAITAMREAVRIEPGDANARNDLGRMLGMDGRLAEARDQFRTALTTAPELDRTRFNYATVLARLGELDAAIEEFATLADETPPFPGAHAGLGTTLLRAERFGEAIRPLQVAVEEMPDDVELRVMLARLFLLAQRPDEAAIHFDHALRVQPRRADLHNELGRTLALLGYLDDARQQFLRALELDPGLLDARQNLDLLRSRLAR